MSFAETAATPSKASQAWILTALCVSLVIVSLDSTVINVALPAISEHFETGTTGLQWVVDAYSVLFAGLLLLMGAIGDRFGHKGLLCLGLTLFGCASAAAALAPTIEVLVALRALMGVAGALIMPTSLAILSSVFTGERRAFALGFWSAAAGAGVAVGPVVGGALLTAWSWRSVFLVNVPLVALAVLADLHALPQTERQRHRFDVLGALLSTLAITLVVAAFIESSPWGWHSGRTVGVGVGGVVLGLLFLVREHRATSPLLRLGWFADRRLTIAAVVAAALFFAMVGASFLLMQYLQLVLGYSPLRAGLAILPIVLGTAVFATASGSLIAHLGHRWLMAGGMVVLAAGLLGLSTLDRTTGYLQILAAGSAFGIGVGLALTPASDSVLGSAAAVRPGVASGINDVAQELGGALGIAVLGTLATDRFSRQLADSPAVIRGRADSLAQAVQTAQEHAPATLEFLRSAFSNAMDTSLVVAAIAAAAGAVLAAGMPRRS